MHNWRHSSKYVQRVVSCIYSAKTYSLLLRLRRLSLGGRGYLLQANTVHGAFTIDWPLLHGPPIIIVWSHYGRPRFGLHAVCSFVCLSVCLSRQTHERKALEKNQINNNNNNNN